MNWEIAGVIAEIIGASTVVVTLFYLAVQIRQNRIAVETASQASISEGWNSINGVILGSAEVGEIWHKGFNHPESLNASEKVRFMILGQSYINQFTLEKKLADTGAISEGQWQSHVGAFHHIMNSRGGKYILESVAVAPDVLEVVRAYKGVQPNNNFLEIEKPSE